MTDRDNIELPPLPVWLDAANPIKGDVLDLMRDAVMLGREQERSEILDAIDDDMPIDRAVELAKLWRAGKLVGGDAHGAAIALLSATEDYEALKKDATRYRWIRSRGAWESEIGMDILSKNPSAYDAAVDTQMAADALDGGVR